MSKIYCISSGDTVLCKIEGNGSSYVEIQSPSIVQAPFTDTVNVGLQHFAVRNINEATEEFEVFGRVTNRIGNLMYVCPSVIYEIDERYPLDATIYLLL